MNIEEELSNFKERIDRYLEKFLNEKIKEAKKISPLSGKIIRSLKDFVLRSGKRIRPALITYSYLALGGKDKRAVEELSVFIELIHGSLLIHDDIVDRDELRRGKPTLHREFEKLLKFKNKKEKEHFGISLAILGGNISSALAFEIILKSKFPAPLKIKILKLVEQMLKEVNFGEITDILISKISKVRLKDVYKSYLYKSTKYTIEAPLLIGATLALAKKEQLRLLSKLAFPLGLAFQIKDDILGIFGEEKQTGKAVGADIKEGKKTLLILETQKRANKFQRKILDRALGNQNLNKRGIERVRTIIKGTGALKSQEKLLKELAEKGKKILKEGQWQKEGRIFLEEIIDFIIERDY